jgi:hypothetical protein
VVHLSVPARSGSLTMVSLSLVFRSPYQIACHSRISFSTVCKLRELCGMILKNVLLNGKLGRIQHRALLMLYLIFSNFALFLNLGSLAFNIITNRRMKRTIREFEAAIVEHHDAAAHMTKAALAMRTIVHGLGILDMDAEDGIDHMMLDRVKYLVDQHIEANGELEGREETLFRVWRP